MAKYNGSGILLYADGVEIAAQKGFTLNANVNLFDITTKQSSGWAEHDKGVRSADVSFDALQSTTGLSDADLFAYIVDRKSLVIAILGFTYPIIGEVNCAAMTVNAPTEEATGLSGSLKIKGGLYRLAGGSAQLLTTPGDVNSYDTMTLSTIRIAAAINLADTAFVWSNTISVATGNTLKVIFSLHKATGQFPTVTLDDYGGVGIISNEVVCVEGVNVITLVATDTKATARLRFGNTDATSFNTTPIYLFKV